MSALRLNTFQLDQTDHKLLRWGQNMMLKNFPLALTYDDVLLVPQRSTVKHRADARTTTQLTANISLEVPFISANIDTVTEGYMAIALARAGGIGIIHRFMSIEDQVREVDRVTRFEGFILEKPYTVRPDKNIRQVAENITHNGISSYLVINSHNKLLGIITRRDVIFENN